MRQIAFLATALLGFATLSSLWLASPDVEARMLPHVASPPEVAALPSQLGEELEAYHFLKNRHSGLAEEELLQLADTIVSEAHRHDLDPQLVIAVIRVESAGYNFAVSRVGAFGLMQIMPPTGEELARELDLPWYGPDTLFDPIVNVKMGTAYLRELADRYDDDIETALAAYNWGPGRIDRRIRRGAVVPSLYWRAVMDAREAQLAQRS